MEMFSDRFTEISFLTFLPEKWNNLVIIFFHPNSTGSAICDVKEAKDEEKPGPYKIAMLGDSGVGEYLFGIIFLLGLIK
jgi:hypothetical protein